MFKGEYQQAVDDAKIRAKAFFWKIYSSHLVLSHEDTVRLNERYLKSIGVSKTLVIDSDLGTGKTGWFYNQVIKDAPLGRQVVCLNPRRSLAKATAKRFGIVDYEDAKKERIDCRLMSLCINSSLQLINPSEPLDVVFMDESDLLIQHLLGGAVPDKIREELIYHNLEMVGNASHVIRAQPLVSDLTLKFLSLAGRENPVKVVNIYPPWKGLPIDFFRKRDKALERLLDIAEQGTPFLCPCNSSNQALRIYLTLQKRFPEKNYLLITQAVATEPEQSAFLAEPNKHADKYDGVIFSPSMETGVSVDSQHFKETVGFCSATEGVGTPEAFVQMMMRGRKTKRISLWVDPQKHHLPTTDEGCAAEAIGRFKVMAQIFEQEGKKSAVFEITPAVELAIKAQAIQNKSKNRTDQAVYALLTERTGCEVNLIDSEPSKLGVEANKEGRKLQKEQYQAEVESAAKLTEVEYERLSEKKTLSLNETWAMRRYRLESELCVDLEQVADKPALFEFWNQGRILHAIRGFEEGLLTEEQAKGQCH